MLPEAWVPLLSSTWFFFALEPLLLLVDMGRATFLSVFQQWSSSVPWKQQFTSAGLLWDEQRCFCWDHCRWGCPLPALQWWWHCWGKVVGRVVVNQGMQLYCSRVCWHMVVQWHNGMWHHGGQVSCTKACRPSGPGSWEWRSPRSWHPHLGWENVKKAEKYSLCLLGSNIWLLLGKAG